MSASPWKILFLTWKTKCLPTRAWMSLRRSLNSYLPSSTMSSWAGKIKISSTISRNRLPKPQWENLSHRMAISPAILTALIMTRSRLSWAILRMKASGWGLRHKDHRGRCRTSPWRYPDHSEWICKLHHDIASALFPDWAGHFRVVNVKVGTHTPPSFYEVPVHMRLYCEDLAVRLSSASGEKDIEKSAEILAFADWRFQWIHPFRDFNGRVSRIILSALLYKLKLPPAETASPETKEKDQYLKALRFADEGDLSSLTEIWMERLSKALDESG